MKSVALRKSGFLATLFAAALGTMVLMPALGDEAGVSARQVSDRLSGAVVAVRLVIQMQGQWDMGETTEEIRATIIDPSGLAVCSLSQVDPWQEADSMMEEEPGYSMNAEVKEVKILQPDGKEIPAKVVLRDKDLDLAFIRPLEPPTQPMPAVDLGNAAKPELLDEVLVLGRLGEAGNRAPYLALDRVHAIIVKPRTFYITGLNTWLSGLGTPVLSLDGRAIGVLVTRSMPSGIATDEGDMPVVLPADEILAVARQAQEQ